MRAMVAWVRARPYARRVLLGAWALGMLALGFGVLELVSRRVLGVWHREVGYRHLQPYLMSGGYAPTADLSAAVGQGFGGPESYGYERMGGTYVFDFESEVEAVADRGTFLFQDRVALANDTSESAARRVFVIGGSAAYGIGASATERRWYMLLEDSLTRALGEPVRMIPAAMIGHVSTQERIALELMVLPRRPDLVVVLDGFNDAALPVVFGVRPGDPYDQGILYENFYSTFFGVRKWLADRSHLARVLVQGSVGRAVAANERRLLESPARMANYHRGTARVYLDNVRHMLRDCQAAGVPCVAFLQPIRAATMRSAGLSEGVDPFALGAYDLILEANRDVGPELRVHDLTGVFGGLDWTSLYVDEVHFNDAGHRLVAEAMYPIVVEALRAD